MTTTKEHTLGLTAAELTARLTALGMPKFRATQILEWIFAKRARSFAEMTNLSLADRAVLEERFAIFIGEVVRRQTATDGTEKILLKWPEGGLTETVMIPAEDDVDDGGGGRGERGSGRGGAGGVGGPAARRTACLSTQVGCPVGCVFCASGLGGLEGNLSVGQIVEQALHLTHLLPREGAGHRLTNVVFMGMGEPLANLEATVGAVRALMAPWAFHISARKITVSTVGLPPQIRRLADMEIPLTLALSLHAPNDELRKQIIPWARKIPLEKIIEAGRHYFEKTGREVTIEYIMLDGVNTGVEQARELARVAKELRANVNLIYYNEVPELGFKRPSGATMFAFQAALRAGHVNAHIRRSRGREIAAACGQLARQDKVEVGKALRH